MASCSTTRCCSQAQLYRPLEILTLVAMFYFVMLTIASFSVRIIETRLDAARL